VCDTKVKFPVLWGGPERVVAGGSVPLPREERFKGLKEKVDVSRAEEPSSRGQDARDTAGETPALVRLRALVVGEVKVLSKST